jgi:hypothetical protein
MSTDVAIKHLNILAIKQLNILAIKQLSRLIEQGASIQDRSGIRNHPRLFSSKRSSGSRQEPGGGPWVRRPEGGPRRGDKNAGR